MTTQTFQPAQLPTAGATRVSLPTGVEPSPPPPLKRRDKVLLLLIPPLVGLGPWASLTPGAAFSPYAFRVLLVIALIPAFGYLGSSYRDAPLHVRRAVNALTLLILWSAVSLVWSPGVGSGLRTIVSLLLGLLSVLVMLGLSRGTDEGITYLRWGYVLALLATGAVGTWEIATGNHLTAASETEAETAYTFSESAISSTLLNPNNYGAFLLALLAPILAIFSKQRNALILLGLSGLIGWAFMLAVNTESRGAVFGFVAVMGLAALALAFINIGYLITALFSAALAAAAIITLAPGQVAKVIDTVTSEADAGSDEFRRNLTWAAIRQFEESFGLGVGLGGTPTTLHWTRCGRAAASCLLTTRWPRWPPNRASSAWSSC